ncbi:hypothetical protein [Nocardioides sp. ChNu-99]|uniref:hypothetical protein n=1 Tax=Nocardioides sp. ChNu-99 TaxID=2839897 RepID=UPI002404BC55|nr:hypothetical protein [Nocardioides sp. ChNu-99]MDF9715700.1 hypothetical protein [Nocardioides sp. ChNu-99]
MPRALLVAAVATLLAPLVLVAWVVADVTGPSGASGATRSSAPTAPPVPAAVAVVRGWDERRSAALADGDADALRSLFAPGPRGDTLAAADLALLAAYDARGLRVVGLGFQLVDVDVVTAAAGTATRPATLLVAVRDRMPRAAVARGDVVVAHLPARAEARRVLRFERHGDDWLLAGSAVAPP